MRIASTSKAFSGAVALTLVAQHRLSLDDTIARLLPSLPNAWGGVTLRELLDHTSGLEDFSEDPAFLDYLVKNLHAAPSPTFILHFIAGTKPRFTPGTAYRYSNTDNFVIALMAEAATHRSYTQLLARYVLRPLGLGGTSLPSSFAMPAPYLHGDHLDPPPAEDVSELVSAAYGWASGGIVSTPADLSTFIRAYAGGRLFPRAVRAAQLQFVPGNSEPIGPGTNSAGLDHVDAALRPHEAVNVTPAGPPSAGANVPALDGQLPSAHGGRRSRSLRPPDSGATPGALSRLPAKAGGPIVAPWTTQTAPIHTQPEI